MKNYPASSIAGRGIRNGGTAACSRKNHVRSAPEHDFSHGAKRSPRFAAANNVADSMGGVPGFLRSKKGGKKKSMR